MTSRRWQNSQGSFAAWSAATRLARYRASVGAEITWTSMDPNPRDLAVASIASRQGHRLLLAFELVEHRDYFLECYRDEDAQSEPDWAEHASRRRPKPVKTPPASLEEAKIVVMEAKKAEEEALADVERGFNEEIEARLRNNDVESALKIVRSMHADCVLRSIAISGIVATGRWDRQAQPFYEIPARPLDSKRAGLMTAWLKSYQDLKEARNALEPLESAEVKAQGGTWRW